MFNPMPRRSTVLIFSLLSLFLNKNLAQKAGLEVTRTTAMDRAQPILNVAVDAEGRKWAANSKGVFQIKAADLSTQRSIPAGEKNVLSYRGGNTDFNWSEEAFKKIANTPCTVTAAWYDALTTTLWLGTDEAGLFQLKTQPQLELIQQYKTVNSKLKSNHITILFQDRLNRLWIGTDKGLMYGPPGRWKADFANYDIQRIREYNTVIYVLADGDLSKAPGGDKWSDLALDTKQLEGQITDFDIDPEGKMWLLSGVLTRFDLLASTYDVFSGPEYYTSQYGNCIAVTAEGAAWVGTDDKGLFMVDKAYSMTLNAFVDQPISCEGNGKDAVLLAKVNGGVPPYTYAWSGGLSGDNPRNVGAGTYTVTVTDSKGKARSAEVPVFDVRLKIKARQKKPESGPGKGDGSAEVDIATNASGIQIKWDNGEVMAVAVHLTTGQHTVTVTDPKGCATAVTVTIGEKAVPLSVAISEKAGIKCAGDKTASLAASATGGKAPYKFAWSNPAFTGETPANVPSGDYQLTVTDAAGATSTAAIRVQQPEHLSVTATATAAASTGGADGKALAQAKGGTGIYLFKWDNGETTYTATKLSAGQRSIVVTDANGCTATATIAISENILPLAVRILEKTALKCAGDKNAVLLAQVNGGKAPFKYAWSNATASGDQISNLAAGDYQLTVTDLAGTTATAAVTLKQPNGFSITATATAPASTGNADGQATALPNSSTGTYTFKWDNGEGAAIATKLAPGQHSVTATDANGCTATATLTISENILPLVVNISEKASIKCAGEKTAALSAQVSGGKAPFQYTWNTPAFTGGNVISIPAGEYQLTVTDATGKTASASASVKQPEPLTLSVTAAAPASTGNTDGKAVAQPKGGAGGFVFQWDSGESGTNATRLGPGQHSVTVTDANSCIAVATVAISENILALEVGISEKTPIKCAGEKATLAAQVRGGKGPFQFAWSDPALKGEQPGNVQPGDYQITITDATGKTATASIAVKQPAPLTLTATVQQPASTGKADAKAAVATAGGTSAYSYQWDNGETTATAVKLNPGRHTVTVTDANNCSANIEVQISENILALELNLSQKTPIKCAGEKAALALAVKGGKPPYAFAWNNPAATGENPTGLDGGDYAVTVTDAKGTTQTAAFTVKAPEPLSIELIRNLGATTAVSNDGKAQVSIKGGTPKFSVTWDTKQTGLVAPKLALGAHSVTVTDANGCTQKIDFQTEKRVLPELTGVIEDGQTIRMRLLNFDTDSDVLKAESLPMLDELFDFMTEHPVVSIEIAGHTNNVPTDDFADKLSTARAKSVADYLFAKGVDPKRVVYKGYGKRQPVAPNTSPEGRKTNQRVEIKILRAK